jgi:hypothetical protein
MPDHSSILYRRVPCEVDMTRIAYLALAVYLTLILSGCMTGHRPGALPPYDADRVAETQP